MASINKVILIGRLGRAPESRSFPNGGTIANASLATDESFKDRDGNKQDRTEWHNLVFHGRLAEVATQYLNKGSLIYVEGSLRTRKWKDKDGADRYSTEINVNEMKMLGGKSGERTDNESTRDKPASNRTSTQARQVDSRPFDDSGFEDDDIPFD